MVSELRSFLKLVLSDEQIFSAWLERIGKEWYLGQRENSSYSFFAK